MGELKDEVTRLRAELDALKAALPTPYDAASAARWQSEMHELRERQATRAAASAFSKADLAAVEAACPPDTTAGLIRDNRAVPGQRCALPSSGQQVSDVRRGAAPSGSGWAHEALLRPSPHARYVDAQLDAQDVKDRRELIEQKARELAMFKATESE